MLSEYLLNVLYFPVLVLPKHEMPLSVTELKKVKYINLKK